MAIITELESNSSEDFDDTMSILSDMRSDDSLFDHEVYSDAEPDEKIGEFYDDRENYHYDPLIFQLRLGLFLNKWYDYQESVIRQKNAGSQKNTPTKKPRRGPISTPKHQQAACHRKFEDATDLPKSQSNEILSPYKKRMLEAREKKKLESKSAGMSPIDKNPPSRDVKVKSRKDARIPDKDVNDKFKTSHNAQADPLAVKLRSSKRATNKHKQTMMQELREEEEREKKRISSMYAIGAIKTPASVRRDRTEKVRKTEHFGPVTDQSKASDLYTNTLKKSKTFTNYDKPAGARKTTDLEKAFSKVKGQQEDNKLDQLTHRLDEILEQTERKRREREEKQAEKRRAQIARLQEEENEFLKSLEERRKMRMALEEKMNQIDTKSKAYQPEQHIPDYR